MTIQVLIHLDGSVSVLRNGRPYNKFIERPREDHTIVEIEEPETKENE